VTSVHYTDGLLFDQKVELPEWIVKEITEDSRYSNASIAKYGWPDEV